MGKSTTSALINGQKLTVYTYRPKIVRSILFVFHGLSRTADSYRDYAIPLADKHGMAVYAPLFDLERFPDWSYQRGGVVHNDVIQPKANWTVGYVAPLLAWARKRENLLTAPYHLFGYSAGGQFMSRIAAYTLADAQRLIVGAPSTYVLPSVTEAVPYGFGCLDSGCVYDSPQVWDQLKAYLALPITIAVGEDDVTNDELNESAAAMRQGANRLERAYNTFNAGQQVAAAANWPFNWRMVVLPDTGHSPKSLLQSDQTDFMFGFV